MKIALTMKKTRIRAAKRFLAVGIYLVLLVGSLSSQDFQSGFEALHSSLGDLKKSGAVEGIRKLNPPPTIRYEKGTLELSELVLSKAGIIVKTIWTHEGKSRYGDLHLVSKEDIEELLKVETFSDFESLENTVGVELRDLKRTQVVGNPTLPSVIHQMKLIHLIDSSSCLLGDLQIKIDSADRHHAGQKSSEELGEAHAHERLDSIKFELYNIQSQ